MKNWKFKYFEKNIKESHTHLFSSLEIKNYLKKLLIYYGLTLNTYQINFSNSTVHIFLSIFNTNTKQVRLKRKKKNYKKIKLKKKQIYSIIKQYKIIKEEKLKLKTFQLFSLFRIKIFESIKIFLKNKYHIMLTIEKTKLNKRNDNIKFRLRRFKRAGFFKQGASIIFTFISKANSEKLLTKFIAKELALTKHHKFFLSFLKENIKMLINQKLSKILGLKILVRGRLNNVMRASSYVIKVGKIPLITPCQKLTYSKTTSYGKNGTLGIKVWVFKKN